MAAYPLWFRPVNEDSRSDRVLEVLRLSAGGWPKRKPGSSVELFQLRRFIALPFAPGAIQAGREEEGAALHEPQEVVSASAPARWE